MLGGGATFRSAISDQGPPTIKNATLRQMWVVKVKTYWLGREGCESIRSMANRQGAISRSLKILIKLSPPPPPLALSSARAAPRGWVAPSAIMMVLNVQTVYL